MIEDSGADVCISSPVRRVEQNGRGVVVTTQAGDAFSAAVVALPLNVLKHVEFSPELGEEKSIASEQGHAGHSVKVWAVVEGAPLFYEGVGQGPKGLMWIGTEHELAEGSLMVGFGSDPEALDAKSVSEVQDAFAAFLPDARVLKVDAHDWNADPYSLGSWMAFRPSQITRLGAGLRRRRGSWPSRRPTWRSDGRGTSTGRSRAEAAPPSVQESYLMRELGRAGRLTSTCRPSGAAYDPPDWA